MRSSLLFPVALLLSVVGCAVDESPTSSRSSAAEVDRHDFQVWRSNKGAAISVRATITNVTQLAAALPTDDRLTRSVIAEGVRDFARHLLVLDGLVGLYLGEVIALDRLRASYAAWASTTSHNSCRSPKPTGSGA